MIRLRPYKQSDGDYLIKWQPADMESFIKWSALRFRYPLDKTQTDEYFHLFDDDTSAWQMTAMDETGAPVGHFLMRKANYAAESVHMGFIIIDPRLRGKGAGKEMITAALRYAFDILRVERVTLGVFENNEPAHRCYLSAGFCDESRDDSFEANGEIWPIINMCAVRK